MNRNILILAQQNDTLNPCQPNPCGANSQCREINGQTVCSCLPNYVGSPPSCRPECTVSSECPQNQACINLKCANPCPGTCGLNALCQTINHSPICSCNDQFTGDPFTKCFSIPRKKNNPIYLKSKTNFLLFSSSVKTYNLCSKSLHTITMWS